MRTQRETCHLGRYVGLSLAVLIVVGSIQPLQAQDKSDGAPLFLLYLLEDFSVNGWPEPTRVGGSLAIDKFLVQRKVIIDQLVLQMQANDYPEEFIELFDEYKSKLLGPAEAHSEDLKQLEQKLFWQPWKTIVTKANAAVAVDKAESMSRVTGGTLNLIANDVDPFASALTGIFFVAIDQARIQAKVQQDINRQWTAHLKTALPIYEQQSTELNIHFADELAKLRTNYHEKGRKIANTWARELEWDRTEVPFNPLLANLSLEDRPRDPFFRARMVSRKRLPVGRADKIEAHLDRAKTYVRCALLVPSPGKAKNQGPFAEFRAMFFRDAALHANRAAATRLGKAGLGNLVRTADREAGPLAVKCWEKYLEHEGDARRLSDLQLIKDVAMSHMYSGKFTDALQYLLQSDQFARPPRGFRGGFNLPNRATDSKQQAELYADLARIYSVLGRVKLRARTLQQRRLVQVQQARVPLSRAQSYLQRAASLGYSPEEIAADPDLKDLSIR